MSIHILSMHPINPFSTYSQGTLSTHHINPLYQHNLSMHTINTLSQPNLTSQPQQLYQPTTHTPPQPTLNIPTQPLGARARLPSVSPSRRDEERGPAQGQGLGPWQRYLRGCRPWTPPPHNNYPRRGGSGGRIVCGGRAEYLCACFDGGDHATVGYVAVRTRGSCRSKSTLRRYNY